MFKNQNFCHIASNNRNNVKVGVFVYRTPEDLATVTVSGYFNERIIDINLHDIIIHEKIDPTDTTIVQRNTLCVVKRTVDNVETKEIHSAWEELTDQAIQDIQDTLANISFSLNDLTDVNINNVQTGDYLRWNGAEWINMAGGGGGSAVWGSVGGDIEDQADLQAVLADKANVDMDNLTDTGANIANWSHNVTNCIAEIPQDIILELSAGVLTLKAGSKVYVPNGVGVYDEVTIASDISFNSGWANTQFLAYYHQPTNTLAIRETNITESGASSALTTQYRSWYDTTNNLIKWTDDYGSNWTSGFSFPVALITCDANSIVSIDQVFNDFGYIGSEMFAIPNNKALASNGRNTDGTVKNTLITNTSVLRVTNPDTSNKQYLIFEGNTLERANFWFEQTTKPTFVENNNNYWYNPDTNLLYYYRNAGNASNGYKTYICAGFFETDANTRITKFSKKTVFRAIDSNDIVDSTADNCPSKLTTVEWVKNKIMASVLGDLYPVGSIYIGTQGSCPLATLIPGSTWQQIQGRYLLASGTIAGTSEYAAVNTYIAAGAPNITGTFTAHAGVWNPTANGAFYLGNSYGNNGWDGTSTQGRWYGFTAYNSNSTYGQSATIRPTAYAVNVWRRTA